ncbi:MAG: hypothetical protein K2N72_02470, partial [Oscillospiraceae bacterium]|nr:hypothetical protein [Oscillospiraceae bacterium]
YISKGILLILGLKAIFDGIKDISAVPSKSSDNAPRSSKKPKQKGSIFDIAGAPEKADCDSSSEISPREAAVLGAALSADSVFTGISAGMGGLSPPVIFVLSFISGICACGGGMLAGGLVCKGCGEKFPAGVITGAGLIIIAVFF